MKTALVIPADLVILVGCAWLVILTASARAFACIGVGSLALAVVDAVDHRPMNAVLDAVLGASSLIVARRLR